MRVDQNARVSLVNLAKAANSTLNARPLAPQAARDVNDGDVFGSAAGGSSLGVRRSPVGQAPADDDGGDDDVMEVAAAPGAAAAAAAERYGDDDGCATTQHAKRHDFLHSREHCTTFPIAADASKRCANCYCYVRDAAAAKCTQGYHCARHGDPRRAERAAHARGDTQQGAPTGGAGTTMAAATVTQSPL